MKYIQEHDVVVMDLVDLEHCGFDHDEFAAELHLAGVNSPEARWPVALLVNFRGGHVVTPDTKEEDLAARRQARESFDMLLARLMNKAR